MADTLPVITPPPPPSDPWGPREPPLPIEQPEKPQPASTESLTYLGPRDTRTEFDKGVDRAVVRVKQDLADEERAGSLLKWQAENSDLSPGTSAEIAKYAAALHLDPQVVRANLSEIQKRAAYQLPWQKIADDHPVLAKFIGDPELGPAVIQDSAALMGLEALVGRWETKPVDPTALESAAGEMVNGAPVTPTGELKLKYPGVVQTALARGWDKMVLDLASFAKASGLANVSMMLDYEEAKKTIADLAEGVPVKDAAVRAYERNARMQSAVISSLNGELSGAKNITGDLRGWGPAGRAVLNTAVEALEMAPMVAAQAALTRGLAPVGMAALTAGNWIFNTALTGGDIYNRLAHYKDPETDKEFSETQKVLASLSAGVVAGTVMTPTITKISAEQLNLLGFRVLPEVYGRVAQEALQSPSVLGTLGLVGKQAGVHVLEGSAVMAAQSAIGAATEELARVYAFGGTADPVMVAKTAAQGFYSALRTLPFFVGWGPTRAVIASYGRAKRAQRSGELIEGLIRARKESGLGKEAPEIHEEFVKQAAAAQDGNPKAAYVNKSTWDAEMSAQGFDPREVHAELLGDKGAAYDAATKAWSADLEIPIEKVGKLGASERLSDFAVRELRAFQGDESLGDVMRSSAKLTEAIQEVLKNSTGEAEAAVRAKIEKLIAPMLEEIVSKYPEARVRYQGRIPITATNREVIQKGLVDWMFADTVQTLARVPVGRYSGLVEFFDDYYDNVLFATLTDLKANTDPAVQNLMSALPGLNLAGQTSAGKNMAGLVWDVRGQKTLYALFNTANATTPFHEWMHLQSWLKSHLLERLQKEGVSAPLLAKHYRDMLALMESPSGLREKQSFTRAELEIYHQSEEKLAHLFEEYLLKHRDPPDALVAASMPAMRATLLETVRAARQPVEGFAEAQLRARGLDTKLRSMALTPEAIAWFDSLVSSEAAIEAAGKSLSLAPLDKVLEGLPEPARAAYLEAVSKTQETARSALIGFIRLAQRSGSEAFIRSVRERIKTSLTGALRNDLGYLAIDFLTNGKSDFYPYEQGFKLDPGEFKATFPLAYAQIEKVHPEIFGKQGEATHNLDMAAVELGFKDKAEMARSLYALGGELRPKFADAVEQGTERQLGALFGSLYKPDQGDLAREALDAMTHSKSLFEKSLIELRWIAEQSGNLELRQRASLLGNETARQLARDAMAQRSWYAFRPDEFLRAERRYAEKAFIAIEAGDHATAYSMKEAQLFNQLFFSEARKAEAELKQNMSRMRVNSKDDAYRQALGRAGNGVGDGMGLVNIFDAITNALGITQRQLPPDVLSGFVDTVQAKLPPGMLIFDPAGLADALARLSSSGPTVGDVSMMSAIVKNIEALAKTINSETMKVREAHYNEVRGNMIADLNRLPPKPPDTFREGRDEGGGRRARRTLEAVDAALLDPELLVEMAGSTAHQYIFKPFLEARTTENRLRKDVLAWVQKAFTEQPKELRQLRDTVVPELETDLPIAPEIATTRAGPRDHGWLWMVALNFGNVHNRQRLLDGFGWHVDKVREALDKHLTDREWDFIESVWKHLDETLWPLIAAKEKRMRGLAPEKVEAVPFTLSNGREIRGGYFPLRYDPKSQRGLVRGVEAATEGREIDMPMVTPHGFVYKRADRFIDLPWLAWHIVPSHINQVIHDVAFGEYMYDMRRLLADPVLQTAFDSRLGPVRNANIKNWLSNVAMNGSEAVAQHQQVLVNSVMGTARSWFVNATLGLSIPVVAADYLNPLVAALGKQVTFRDVAQSYATAPWQLDFVAGKSEYMRDRRDNYLRGFQEQLMAVGGSVRRQHVNDVLYSLMDGLDKLTSTTIWMAKYRQVIREGRAGELTPELEAKAVEAADYAVRRSLPSASVLERSAILRDRRTLGMIVIFYSWFNRTYNLARGVTHQPYVDFVNNPGAKTGATLAGATGRALALLFFSGAVGDYVSGRGREQDETWGQYWARKAIASPFTALPLVGGAADYAAGLAITGKGKQMPLRTAPVISSIQNIVQSIGNAANQRHYDEDRVNDLVALALMMGGLPAAQYRRTVGYATRLTLGHEQPRTLSEAAGGLLYGSNPYGNKPSNPATDIGEALK